MENQSDESAEGILDRDGAVRASYEWSSTPPLIAVVETVSAAVDRDVMETEPLYESVDPDALESLVRRTGADGDGVGLSISFAYSGHQVTVHGNGDVVVRPDPLAGPGDE